MNKEYYVLTVEDTSSAEYTKNYWKKSPEFSLWKYITLIPQHFDLTLFISS